MTELNVGKSLGVIQQHIADLQREKNEQAKLAAKRQQQLEQANKAKDAQAKLAAERQQQLEQVNVALERKLSIRFMSTYQQDMLSGAVTRLNKNLELMKNQLPAQMDQLQGSLDLIVDLNKSWRKPKNKEVHLLDAKSYSYYKSLQEDVPFLLLDCKSTPRSGLHYLRNRLGTLLGEHFSFCERYQESSCCKVFPCSSVSYAEYAKGTGEERLRLVKSHDFTLSDPIFSTVPSMYQLVLVRDPLFVLTSWFCLWQIERYKEDLAEQGVDLKKIHLSHDRELVSFSYSVLKDRWLPPSDSEVKTWLAEKGRYLLGFYAKWVVPSINNSFEEVNTKQPILLKYDDLDRYIQKLINKFEGVKTNGDELDAGFFPRSDPFSSALDVLSNYMHENKLLFESVSEAVLNIDCDVRSFLRDS